MRPFLYWLTSTAVAVLAAGASEHQAAADLLWTPDAHMAVAAVPEPSRAILLGVGIMAIAFTYRRAWLNFKGRE